MKKTFYPAGLSFVLAAVLSGCSSSPQSPTSPSAASVGSAAATASDGSTMKVTSPAIISPIDGVTVDTRTPTLHWANSTGHYGSVGLAYTIEVSTPAAVVYTRTVGETPNTGSHRIELELTQGTVYSWRIRAALGTLVGPWSIWAEFRATAPVVVVPPPTTGSPSPTPTPTGFRTPDPPAGQRLPRVNGLPVVQRVASSNPRALQNSCQDHGGSWEFMDLTVDALQATDLRWGYNGKRGNSNDPSHDVVDYHYGAGPSADSTQVYIIDIIGGHCGASPTVTWLDVTNVTADAGSVGRYITRRPGRR